MVRITLFLLLFSGSTAYAGSCDAVVDGFEERDVMYVLCKELPVSNDKNASDLVQKVMAQYKGPPDEIIVYFIGSLDDIGKIKTNSKNLVGFYYTHSNVLTTWPGQINKKRVFHIQWD